LSERGVAFGITKAHRRFHNYIAAPVLNDSGARQLFGE
jgi:hypothetical protein